MIRRNLMIFAAVMLCAGGISALAQVGDREGFKGPALFTKLPNYWGDWVHETEFDAHNFRVSKEKNESVEGHLFVYMYRYDNSKGGVQASRLQIFRNYQNAAKRIGGKVLYEDDEQTTLLVSKDGKETWVSVEAGNDYTLTILERQTMQQDVGANAEALQGGLAQVGHVEVPGIFFDFNKSEVKPESKPALEEVGKMLKANPTMKVWGPGDDLDGHD